MSSPLLTLVDFYPRPPRGGRLVYGNFCASRQRFLSTPSARRATFFGLSVSVGGLISIHALREEGDVKHESFLFLIENFYPRPPRGGRPVCFSPNSSRLNFYPRPPRGGRLSSTWATSTTSRFLSTPSARRATSVHRCYHDMYAISIHALREEGDARRSTSP